MALQQTYQNKLPPSFWDNYIAQLNKLGINNKLHRWYVLRVEQFLRSMTADSLDKVSTEEVESFLRDLLNQGTFADWQLRQAVDAIQSVGLSVRATWVSQIDWDYFRASSKPLETTHPTIARAALVKTTQASLNTAVYSYNEIRRAHEPMINRLVNEIRRREYSYRTEQTYEAWLCRYIAFNKSCSR